MPTYEYECEKYGYRLEEFQTLSEEPITVCPKCGGKVHRLIGEGSGIIFKGSGFYATDYARKNTFSSPKKEDSDSGKKSSEKKDTGSTDESSKG